MSTVELYAAGLHVQVVKRRMGWDGTMTAPGEDAAISRDSLPLILRGFKMNGGIDSDGTSPRVDTKIRIATSSADHWD